MKTFKSINATVLGLVLVGIVGMGALADGVVSVHFKAKDNTRSGLKVTLDITTASAGLPKSHGKPSLKGLTSMQVTFTNGGTGGSQTVLNGTVNSSGQVKGGFKATLQNMNGAKLTIQDDSFPVISGLGVLNTKDGAAVAKYHLKVTGTSKTGTVTLFDADVSTNYTVKSGVASTK